MFFNEIALTQKLSSADETRTHLGRAAFISGHDTVAALKARLLE
jgi:hypothetical protein